MEVAGIKHSPQPKQTANKAKPEKQRGTQTKKWAPYSVFLHF
jgi:hypothetical protein